MTWFIVTIATVLWAVVLYIIHKAKLPAWQFIWGSLGSFGILMFAIAKPLAEPMSRFVCVMAGLVGSLTHSFSAFFKYGILYVSSKDTSFTLQVDMECSGVIEMLAFLCLLAFFGVYTFGEKVMAGLIGTFYLMLANAIRLVIICESVHIFGPGSFYIVHTYVARIIFYLLTVLLYFYVFTKAQLVRIKVGSFTYGTTK